MSALRHVFARLGRRPAFTVTAVVTLALGVGATVALFSVVHSVLLKPLPYEDADRLVALWQTAPGLGFDRVSQSAATYFTFRDEADVFTDVALWNRGSSTVTGLAEPERVASASVTDGFFPLLGVRPAIGRLPSAADDQPDAARVVVLSHAYWQSRFGGSADVLGTTLRIDGELWEVIGVVPAGFRVWGGPLDLYLPMRLDRSKTIMGQFNYRGLARLAPGVTIAQAEAEMTRLLPVAVERFPGGLTRSMLEEARVGSDANPLMEEVVGDVRDVLWVLFATVGLVLLIACANVANLFLVRAEERHREMALRRALGAGRVGVLKQLLSESVSLGLLGGFAGLALAWAALRLLVRTAPEGLPRVAEIGIDPVVIAFALVVSVLAGAAFGLVPALRLGRGDLVRGLREGARGGTVGRERSALRSALVVTQVALALVLLISSGLLVRSFRALRNVDPGFSKAEQLLTFRLSVPEAEVADGVEAVALVQRVIERIGALPGVASAAPVSALPMSGRDSNDPLAVEDFPSREGQLPPIRRYKFAGGGYASTMGQGLLLGRELSWEDTMERRPVVVVTESLARAYWPSPEQALGKRIGDLAPSSDGSSWKPRGWKEIVGVVSDVHADGLDQPVVPIVYWPLLVEDFWEDEGPYAQRFVSIVVRSAGPLPATLVPEVQREVWAENPNLPLAELSTMQEIVDRSLARTSFTLTMLALAAGMALALGSVGLYGVLSYLVTQRTREIGVRMALGAQRRAVTGMMVRHGMLLTAVGLGVGLLAAAGVTRLLGSLLFGVQAIDPTTYVAVSLGLAGVALLASGLASLRAAKVDPIRALRAE